MSTILITGGNRGLGLEAGRQLTARGHDVWLGARDEERGKAAADRVGARCVQLDVGSGLGSLTRMSAPSTHESHFPRIDYASSKSAVSMLTVQYALLLPQLRVNVVNPGWTATDFTDHQGTQTVEEGVIAIVRAATLGPDGPTGTFIDRYGNVPW